MSGKVQNVQPVEALPVGLVSWYAPGKRPVALVTYWMAMIGGPLPRIRLSWPGRRDACSLFWPGGDFILNLPDPQTLPLLRKLASQGRLCFDIENDLGQLATKGTMVCAPRLSQYPSQLECRNGKVDNDPFLPEVSGEVVLLHLGSTELQVHSALDLCEVNPFRLPAD